MSLGYAPYLLMHSKAVYSGMAPSTKITPPGYFRSLLENSRANIVSQGIDDGSGHIKSVQVKYRTRLPLGASATTDTCDLDIRPAYSEATIAATQFRKLSIFLEDDTLARYMNDASSRVQMVNGIPTLTGVTPLMQEQMDMIMESANGLLGDINNDLLVAQATAFGKNQVTGSTASTAVNFPLTLNGSLTTGMDKVMADAEANEMNLSNSYVVGSGLVANYYRQQIAKGVATNGVNTALLASPNFYTDLQAASAWGTNQFGIFEKNAVQFIDINRYTGFKAGIKGSSFFGTLPMSVSDSAGNSISINIDIQMKYVDCPTEVVVSGYVDPQSVNRGWILILSKSFDQFNIPVDAYDASDRLTGNNGTLRYTASNS